MDIWGETGRLSPVFFAQNLFISSLAVVPMGTALENTIQMSLSYTENIHKPFKNL